MGVLCPVPVVAKGVREHVVGDVNTTVVVIVHTDVRGLAEEIAQEVATYHAKDLVLVVVLGKITQILLGKRWNSFVS